MIACGPSPTLFLVHQKTKKGIILCGEDPEKVLWTHYCAHVTCEKCKAEIDKIVDSVFTPLE